MADTPTLSEVLLAALRSDRLDLHTCMPGTVESFDETTQTANILPGFKGTGSYGDTIELPIITSVPVVYAGSARGSYKFKLQQGDKVMLMFAERSLENWLEKLGQQDPEDERMHALTDAVAIPWAFQSQGFDLLSVLDELLDALLGLTVTGPLPLTPATITALTSVKTKLESMR